MLKYKWGFIAGLTALAVWAFLPLDRKVRLGLDLKGGVHLMIRVLTDEAIRAELDDSAQRLRQRLDERKIKYAAVDRTADSARRQFRVLVTGLEPDGYERARKVAETTLPGFRFDSPAQGQLAADLPGPRAAEIADAAVEQARNTIEERINATGVAEPLIQRQGLDSDRILVQLPGASDPEHVKRLIGRVALLELKLVESFASTREEAVARYQGSLPSHLEILEGSDEEGGLLYYVVQKVPVVTGRDLTRALPARDELGQPSVSFTLNAEGASKFGDATGRNVGRQLAIVLDNRVQSAPRINSRITDNGQITGGFTAQEARDLALVLRAGALPAPIQYLEERAVGPFLGKDSIDKGVRAGVAGLIAIIVLMVLYYRLSGLNAVVALLLNGVLLLGAMALLRATLTLPGIAGFILTLGMAVDANVLIFEAIREAIRNGVPPKRAITEGFDRAFSTIVDSNLTTLLAAGALWMLGAGPVRGFGVTLFLGLVISMFTAYYVSKTIYETFVLRREFQPGESLSI